LRSSGKLEKSSEEQPLLGSSF